MATNNHEHHDSELAERAQETDHHRPACSCRPGGAAPPTASILDNPEWQWFRQLVSKMENAEQHEAAEKFFMRLLDATTASALGEALEDIDRWDRGSQGSPNVARALKLLGIDKKLSIERSG
jgi:hypothetical protein